jgi:glycosyltransferase involved in cell wall biosynthesis
MRVLQLINSAGYYGAEAMLTNMAGSLTELGCHTIVGVFRNAGAPRHMDIAKHARRRGLQVDMIPCEGKADWETTKFIREHARRENIDVIHTHGYKADIYGYAASRRLEQPIIATCHNWTSESLSVQAYGILDRLILRRFDQVVAVSQSVADWLRRSGVAADRIAVIDNGIDLTCFRDAHASYAEEIRKGQRIAIGMVSRLVLAKGPQILLMAAQEILKEFPTTLFVLVGDGPARKQLEELARSLHIEQSVIFAGQRDDMPSVYASLDIAVLPSFMEAMPMSVMEAMAAGKPVIATRVGSIPRMISDGRTGFVVASGTPTELKDAVVKLLRDAELRRTFGVAGQSWAVDNFSSHAMARRYLDEYERLLRN